MLRHNAAGFSVTELLIVIAIASILSMASFTFFNTSLSQYLSLQKEGTSLTFLASQSQRVATVLRGITDITEVSSDDITCYSYFYPRDSFVSLIHYYKVNSNTQLLADVTPMSANPPIGTLL